MSAHPLASAQERFLAQVLETHAPGDTRLAVYHRTALAARVGALAATYPVLRRLVGEAFFGEAARVHAAATPSASGDLHDYGARFPGFLASYEPAAALEYLADVARLEWAVHEAQHAADDERMDFAALGEVAPGELARVRIGLRPCVRLVESEHPILSIWHANQPDRDGVPDRTEGGQRVVVRRSGHDVQPVEADAASWALLEVFSRAGTLGDGVDALAPGPDSLEGALARLAALEVLGDFTLGPRG